LKDQDNDSPFQFLLPYNLIQILGEITPETAAQVTEKLLMMDFRNQVAQQPQPIHLLINSPGGAVVAGWQICDIMDSIVTPVHTIGTGELASAALMVFINGEAGNRILSKKASVMSHQYSWGVQGTYSNLKAASAEFENVMNRLTEHFVECSGLDKPTVRELLLSDDNWLTPAKARKFGLADKVLNFKKKNPFKIIRELKPENQRKAYEEEQENAAAAQALIFSQIAELDGEKEVEGNEDE
jgi:ATP-dependent Clp protease protease subunit